MVTSHTHRWIVEAPNGTEYVAGWCRCGLERLFLQQLLPYRLNNEERKADQAGRLRARRAGELAGGRFDA